MIKTLFYWALQIGFGVIGFMVFLAYAVGGYRKSYLVTFVFAALVWAYGMYLTQFKGQSI